MGVPHHQDVAIQAGGRQLRPPAALYRLSKFVRRHRAGVAACIVVALSLAAGISTSLWQARAAKSEAVKARETKVGASLLSLQDTAIAETVLNRAVSEAAPLGPDHLKAHRARSLQS
jgi:hypothetical protein